MVVWRKYNFAFLFGFDLGIIVIVLCISGSGVSLEEADVVRVELHKSERLYW